MVGECIERPRLEGLWWGMFVYRSRGFLSHLYAPSGPEDGLRVSRTTSSTYAFDGMKSAVYQCLSSCKQTNLSKVGSYLLSSDKSSEDIPKVAERYESVVFENKIRYLPTVVVI